MRETSDDGKMCSFVDEQSKLELELETIVLLLQNAYYYIFDGKREHKVN